MITILINGLILLGACVAGGYLAVILSWAAWKKSWAGHDLAQSKTVMVKVVASTGIVAWAQQLTA